VGPGDWLIARFEQQEKNPEQKVNRAFSEQEAASTGTATLQIRGFCKKLGLFSLLTW
jgi:hypothetical protein